MYELLMVQEDHVINIKEESSMHIVLPKFETQQDREAFFVAEYSQLLGEQLTEFMLKGGFCTAPASSCYHGAYGGALFDHSHAVALILEEYTSRLGLSWEHRQSPKLVGILHDLCKIDQYDFKMDSYVHKHSLIEGHAEKSLIYALSNGAKLTQEEVLCIRYHMGAFKTEDWNAYGESIQNDEKVLYTHTADMHASRVLGV